MNEPGPAPRDFSTGVWREFRMGSPRPAVYLSAAAAYLFFAMLMLAEPRDQAVVLGLLTALVAAVGLGFSFVPALYAARHGSGRRWRGAMRARLAEAVAGAIPRDQALRQLYRRELSRLAAAPGLAAALLAPLCAGAGLILAALAEPIAGVLVFGALLAVDLVAAMLASTAVGFWTAQLEAPRKPRVRAVIAAVILLALRGTGVLAAGVVYDWLAGAADPWSVTFFDVLLGADAAGCLLACLVLDRTGPGLLGAALARREDDLAPGSLADEEPESLGLDVSFWSLFRWRLLRDPLVRAERRAFWTWPRLAALWLGVAAAEAGIPILFETGILWQYMPGLALEYLVAVVVFLLMLPYWFIPVMVAGSLASQRRSGLLESLATTPAAPLRLAAAQLAGKLGHFVLAIMVLGFARELIWLGLSETGRYYAGSSFLWSPLGWLVAAQTPLVITAVCGAVALCFAARFRSLFAALTLSYAMLLPMFLGAGAAQDWLYREAGLYQEPGNWNATLAPILGSVLLLLAYGAVLRVCLVAAARRLALPPEDRA